MLSTKKHYYLYLKDYYKFDLNLIKIKNKFSVIYDGNIKKSKTICVIRVQRKASSTLADLGFTDSVYLAPK